MKSSEVASRVTGFSTPIFGLSWTPATSDVEVARGVISFLEDKRVLYAPYEVEVAEHVVESVLDIRRQVTQTLVAGGISSELSDPLRTIRAACRKFLDQAGVESDAPRIHLPPTAFGVPHGLDIAFNQSLGELRGAVGLAVARIAAAHGLDVEDELASTLPAQAE